MALTLLERYFDRSAYLVKETNMTSILPIVLMLVVFAVLNKVQTGSFF